MTTRAELGGTVSAMRKLLRGETITQAQHTPGPWRVILRQRTSKPDRFGRSTTTQERFINGADGLGSIAKLYIGHNRDACLIAAAPELLEALQAMQKACDEWAAEFTQKKRAMNWGIVNDAYVKAAKAIASAKGEA